MLIDDVVTTGATIKYAAESLRQAGATQIWVAVIARQPLD
ncbi:MAG: phosphoribosyltransferase family protein [Candidatus Saccharimonadales bacterium]